MTNVICWSGTNAVSDFYEGEGFNGGINNQTYPAKNGRVSWLDYGWI